MTEEERCPTCESDERGLLVGECADRATRYGESKRVRLRLVDPWHLSAESRVQELEGERAEAWASRNHWKRAATENLNQLRAAESHLEEARQEAHEWKRIAEERAHNLRIANSE